MTNNAVRAAVTRGYAQTGSALPKRPKLEYRTPWSSDNYPPNLSRNTILLSCYDNARIGPLALWPNGPSASYGMASCPAGAA